MTNTVYKHEGELFRCFWFFVVGCVLILEEAFAWFSELFERNCSDPKSSTCLSVTSALRLCDG